MEKNSIHFWDLPRNYVIIDSKFKNRIMKKFMKITKTKYNANKITNISRSTISRYLNENNPKININFLLRIIVVINNSEYSLEIIEKKIFWIGNPLSQGIINPKLPFIFDSRESARFLAAICNEGWISDGAYYSNSSPELRNSVKKDALSTFGGDQHTIKEWIKEKDQYLSFPSVIRDVLVLLTEFKGIKSENNPPIPSFIFKNNDLICGWLEQTIADEGCVKYYPKTYRREIAWKRSFSKELNEYKLNKDEIEMLFRIGIKCNLYQGDIYKTKKNIEKIRLQITITKRNNLLKLRNLIIIPENKKNNKFTEIIKGFVRYKEPLKIKEIIKSICKEKGYINSVELQKKMGYKTINTAIKWIKFYSKNNLLRCIKESSYNKGVVGRSPAKYVLNKP